MNTDDAPEMVTVQEAIDITADCVKGYVDRSFDEFEAWIRGIEKRLVELETNQFSDEGVWVDLKSYRINHGVTHSGSYWIAQRSTQPGEKPGSGNCWRLAVKAGKDGRDARDR